MTRPVKVIDLVHVALSPVQVELVYELVATHVKGERTKGSREPYLGDLEESLAVLRRCPC